MNANIFHLQTPKLPNPTLKCASISRPPTRLHSSPVPPARDRVIDFGTHKGKPLGALPSGYLKWVSSTLRARDTHHWANLADQVLRDPIYRDRIEWEFAESVLRGDRAGFGGSGSGRLAAAAAAELVEISERFGWDNDDKDGWKRVDFELLGTSRGGRIPRKLGEGEKREEKRAEKGAERREGGEGEGRRRERRERGRRVRRGEGIGVNVEGRKSEGGEKVKEEGKVCNPFPGREGLLRDVLQGRRFL